MSKQQTTWTNNENGLFMFLRELFSMLYIGNVQPSDRERERGSSAFPSRVTVSKAPYFRKLPYNSAYICLARDFIVVYKDGRDKRRKKENKQNKTNDTRTDGGL
jgi:hypothetical protein